MPRRERHCRPDVLRKAMGIKRFSLYAESGGRERLLLAALGYYHRQVTDAGLREPEGAGDGMAAIRGSFTAPSSRSGLRTVGAAA